MNKLPKKPRNENMYKAILSLNSVEECMRFFDDLCTVSELMAMEQRYQVATCLNEGMIYNDILSETGASSATISRVNRSLQYGSGGYAIVQEKRKIIKCEDVHSSAESPALCGKAVQILRRINAAYAERMLRIAHHLRLYAAEIVQNGGRIAFIRQMLPSQAAQLYLFKCHVSPAFPEYFSAVPAK